MNAIGAQENREMNAIEWKVSFSFSLENCVDVLELFYVIVSLISFWCVETAMWAVDGSLSENESFKLKTSNNGKLPFVHTLFFAPYHCIAMHAC